jgi:hypothetical protein
VYGGRKTKVEVDGDLAVAWTPYVFRYGGVVHHEGTNIFHLLKNEDGEWKISGVADTYRSFRIKACCGSGGGKVLDAVEIKRRPGECRFLSSIVGCYHLLGGGLILFLH